MKHRIAIIASVLLLGLHGPAAADLSAMERRLYSHDFAGEPVEARVARLETQVFGQVMGGSYSEREARLESALVNVIAKPLPDPTAAPPSMPGRETSAGPMNGSPPPKQAPPRVPDATDYPTVTAVEREVFGRDFIYDDITRRLSRLEKKVFQRDYPELALIDRVDKLLMRYPSARPMTARSDGDGDSVLSSLPNTSDQFTGSGSDTYAKINLLERKILGRENPEALMTERLDALEQVAFGHHYSGQSVDTRLTRLLKDYNASVSRAAYAGPQGRPAIQPRPAVQPAPSTGYSGGYMASGAGTVMLPGQPSPPQRQNIQIGAGMSSASRYQFSPELMEMLPNDVRQQFQTQAPVAAGGGTVTYQERLIYPNAYPGFQPYGPNGIPYQNYYGSPGSTVRERSYSSTMVIPPQGQSAPTAAYTGNPAVLRDIEQLEIQVFGQPNLQEPVPVRLSRLEATIGGHMYPMAPDAERLINLQKLHRYRSLGQLLGTGKGSNASGAPTDVMLGIPLSPSPIPAFQEAPSFLSPAGSQF